MRSLLILGTAMFLGGCAAAQFDKDMGYRDWDSLESHLLAAQSDPKYRYKIGPERLHAAKEALSQHYFRLYSDGNKHLNLGDFDDLCRQKIQSVCTQNTRDSVEGLRVHYAGVEKREREAREKEREQRAEEQAKRDARITALKSGKLKVTYLWDAQHLHSPKDGSRLLGSPYLKGGDGKYYEFKTNVTDMRGGTVISWLPDYFTSIGSYRHSAPRWGAIIRPQKVPKNLTFGQEVTVVGKYTSNQRLPLVDGSSALVPVFSEAYIFVGTGGPIQRIERSDGSVLYTDRPFEIQPQ
ncbi:hypothetical protein [Alloalcanivorax xenomutans]|uniref:hypothetical protein n=1 Tax=Alloalcanivorax xenomutans TaxID=1094342 RepID=UPI0006D7ADCF|nr:hypothetical protein [Alloalcanivorax xenomutans]